MGIRSVFEVLVYSNIFISLGMLSVAAVSSLILGLPLSASALLPPFLVAFSMYTLNRKFDLEEDMLNDRPRALFICRHKAYLHYYVAISYAIAFLLALPSPSSALLLLFPLASGILYSVRLLPFRYSRLKEIPVVKNLLVAANWAVLGVLYPLVFSSAQLSPLFLFLFFFVFIRLFIGAAFFDMRDVEGDLREKIRTLPVILGKPRALKLFFILNVFSFFSAFLAPSAFSFYLVFMPVYGFVWLFLYARLPEKYLYDFVVDAEYILMLFFVFAGVLFK